MPRRGRHPKQPLTRELRASDDDREQVVELLRQHYGAGRLSADELAERIEQAYGARTYPELGALTLDLPTQRDSPAAHHARSGRRRRSGSANRRSERVVTPAGRGLRAGFRIHLVVYIVVNLALVCIWAVTGGGYFWPIWPLIGWGIGVGAHYSPILAGVGTRAPRLPPPQVTPASGRERAADRDGATRSGESASLADVAASVGAERPNLRPAAAPDGTVTILFSDIEGSTELNERLGDDRWLELLRVHHRNVREQLDAYGGFEVKVQGDSFMVAFSSARRAIDCAQAIQRACAAELDGDRSGQIRVRIGLHTGEPLRQDGDFYGKAVVLAARIAGEANGGEILTSAIVKEMVAQSGSGICFDDERELSLKGLAGTYRLYRVADSESPASGRRTSSPPSPNGRAGGQIPAQEHTGHTR